MTIDDYKIIESKLAIEKELRHIFNNPTVDVYEMIKGFDGYGILFYNEIEYRFENRLIAKVYHRIEHWVTNDIVYVIDITLLSDTLTKMIECEEIIRKCKIVTNEQMIFTLELIKNMLATRHMEQKIPVTHIDVVLSKFYDF